VLISITNREGQREMLTLTLVTCLHDNNISLNEVKKSFLSIWRGATNNVSISAPAYNMRWHELDKVRKREGGKRERGEREK
jgi:hypothetical protein